MAYDHQAQQTANQEALAKPQPGDYWQEMFCPYFMVVAVNEDRITVLSCMGGPDSYNRKHEPNAKIDNSDGTWSFDYNKSMVVNRAWMESAVRYSNIDGFVADVVRNSERNQRVVSEWIQHRGSRLIKELKDLGPELSHQLLMEQW